MPAPTSYLLTVPLSDQEGCTLHCDFDVSQQVLDQVKEGLLIGNRSSSMNSAFVGYLFGYGQCSIAPLGVLQ